MLTDNRKEDGKHSNIRNYKNRKTTIKYYSLNERIISRKEIIIQYALRKVWRFNLVLLVLKDIPIFAIFTIIFETQIASAK